MLPIRLKVVLLAALAIFTLGMSIISHQLDLKRELNVAQTSLKVVDRIAALSQMVHCLQKERGLTGALLANHRRSLQEQLEQQRLLNNQSCPHDQALSLNPGLLSDLTRMRERVDQGQAGWAEAEVFYTGQVDLLLTGLSREVAQIGDSDGIANELHSVKELAHAREHFGLVRAHVARALERGVEQRDELLIISWHYRSFLDHLATFLALVDGADSGGWRARLTEADAANARALVESLIQGAALPADSTTLSWWLRATGLIDALKVLEAELLEQVRQHAQQRIEDSRRQLRKRIAASALLFLLITTLAAMTVRRILKALSILVNALLQVEKTHDFGLRIDAGSRDEFGQLGLSINKLLTFTDNIVRQKERLAATDSLTGIPNRRSFLRSAQAEVARAKRYGTTLSLIFCDLDHFKDINDQHGHVVGDDILKTFAYTLKKNLRQGDLLARWGGEEFVILAPETGLSRAAELAEKLRLAVLAMPAHPCPQLTCSFGVSERQPTESLEECIRRADQAVYAAKATGRNCVCQAEAPLALVRAEGDKTVAGPGNA